MTKKPLLKRPVFWIAAIVVVFLLIAISQCGHDDAPVSASPSTGGPASGSSSAPAADDPLSDGGWGVSDIQIADSQFGTSVTARVTNGRDATRTGLFTLTVFSNGQRIGDFSGSASDVEAGQTSTVTFVGSTEHLDGDPTTFTYEFQNDL